MRQDILTNDTHELEVVNGDFIIGQSDQQHVQHIIEAQKGEYKNSPLVGFGIINFVKRDEKIASEFKRDLKIQLENDGYTNPSINLNDGFAKLKIEI